MHPCAAHRAPLYLLLPSHSVVMVVLLRVHVYGVCYCIYVRLRVAMWMPVCVSVYISVWLSLCVYVHRGGHQISCCIPLYPFPPKSGSLAEP